jgi:hypothetical protein
MNDRSGTEILFFAALEKAGPAERAAYLDDACAGNESLRRRVETLLEAHTQVGQFLERPIAEAEACGASFQRALSTLERRPTDLSFLAPSSQPGSLGRLDHYEILEVIGQGGMGIVLRARDTKLERIVAIKVLAPLLGISSSARQRFVREARAAAAITHDNIIAIHAVEDAGPVPYLVMQFIDGPTLQARIDRTGPLALKEVLRIGLQIAEGLAAAHRQGLIHRDIKPANILLENGVQRVKITDFGLAHAVDEDSQVPSGFIAGTPAYMSPEQAHGEHIDHRSDLYSLGTVLYALCTGQTPFEARTTIEVLQAVREDTPRPVREVNPDVPEWLSELIARLHARDPAGRPASAQKVAESLATGGPQGQLPLLLPTAAAAARPGTANRPWRWAAAAAVLLVAGLGLTEATGVTNMRGTVIRLFSPEGTLVVEVDDPGVSVAMDGSDVIITGAGVKEIRLKPGQYKVEASKEGTLVRRELITVTRDGRQVVRISKESVEHVFNLRDPWEKSVAVLPAEQQVEAVARRLKELNPRFDGKVKPTIENGVVTGLEFFSDEVKDLSPVHVLDGLRVLICEGSAPGKGTLEELRPLRGLRLIALNCSNTRVADLSPLQGMPLTSLHCYATRVTDLAPLKGMRLRWLGLTNTAEVADLAPLRGMPLIGLDLCGLRRVSDLRPLEGMPLTYLNLSFLPVSDLSVLASMKSLQHLVLEDVPVSDLTPLRGLPVARLGMTGTRVTDLTPLKGLPLYHLVLDYRPEDEKILRSLPGLAEINNKPAAQFWKEMEGN